MSRRHRSLASVAPLLCWVAASAGAQEGVPVRSAVGDYRDCGPIASPAERLACFDAVYEDRERQGAPSVASPETAAGTGASGRESARTTEGATAARLHEENELLKAENAALREEKERVAAQDAAEEVAASEGDSFGLAETRAPRTPGEIRREMILTSARRVAGDRGVYVMDNGQVWTLVTGSYRPVKPGVQVVIEEALFGSYRMIIEGRGYRVRRVR